MPATPSHITVALWSDPATGAVSEFLTGKGNAHAISSHRVDAEEAMRQLMTGEVDVALLPANLVLSTLELLDVLPAVAVSVLAYPFETLAVENLGTRKTVELIIEPGQELMGFVAEVVLKEQYGCIATRRDKDESNAQDAVRFSAEADDGSNAFVLDIGREWYELVSYPLVWALFVTRRDAATPHIIRTIRDAVIQMEAERKQSGTRSVNTDEEQVFHASGATYRLDDLAVASLTEFCEFMYYYGEVSEIPQLVLATYAGTGETDDA